MTQESTADLSPAELARQAAEGIRAASGIERHDVALTLGSGWAKAADLLGETVAETFMMMYYFERAARTYIIALSTGRDLRELSPDVAEITARQQEGDPQAEADFMRGMRMVLDAESPDYKH